MIIFASNNKGKIKEVKSILESENIISLKEAGGIIIEEVGMHREPFYKRLFNFKKYFKPKPYHLFVVKKK